LTSSPAIKPLADVGPGNRAKVSGPGFPVQPGRTGKSAARGLSRRTETPTLDELYRHHAAKVSQWVAWLTGRDVEVEDIVHEVFLVVHKRRHTLRSDASVGAWLYAITIRVVSDRRRARRWRRWFGWVGGGDAGGAEAMKNAQSTSASPLEAVEQKEAKTLTRGILDELSEDYRTVLILFEFQGMCGEEIAALTGTSVANVWLRLHRARKQFLRRLLAWEAKEAGGRAS
jgi:RNA polymerase sigma-70 factor (ECF subfamily)